ITILLLSSRRRHTISKRDWSSDVCSSDLWENGDDLTAKDFVYGWQRSIDPKTASEYAYLLDSVKNAKVIEDGDMKPSALGIEAIDDQTLKVTLESPASYFLQELTMPVFFPENQKFVEAKGNKF